MERLRARCDAIREALAVDGIRSRVVDSEGSVGGGAFPTTRLPSAAVALEGPARELDARLRAGRIPVIGRIVDDELLLDVRSVPDRDDASLLEAVREALA